MMRKLTIGAAVVATLLTSTPAALASPSQDVISGTDAFACEGLPPYHCINVKSRGNTGLIMVFAPDPRGPAEGVSFDEKADSRPCPHDVDVDGDGTWWSPVDGMYVCHHKPTGD